MGKNNKSKNNKKKTQAEKEKMPAEQEEEQKHDVAIGSDQVEPEVQTEEESKEAMMTPEEKAQKYQQMQMEVYQNYVKEFDEEEKQSESKYLFSDRQKELEKREKEELKKFEKIFKKEQSEVEDLFQGPGNDVNASKIKLIKERITKTILETIKYQNIQKKLQQSTQFDEQKLVQIDLEVQKQKNKKNMFQSICSTLLSKNYELYFEHQVKIEEEQKERQKLASDFQDRMKEVTNELEVQKETKQAEFKDNQDTRDQITAVITEYKLKEENYRMKMDSYNKIVQGIEIKLKDNIEKNVSQTLKQVERERLGYTNTTENVNILTEKIKGYKDKFDKLKEDMSSYGKKFESYNQEIDNRRIKIQTLETEIQTFKLIDLKQQKQDFDIQEEKKKLIQQVDTLKNLNNALNMQYNVIKDTSNKENDITNTNN